MSGSPRSRASLITAATMGLLLLVNLSSAANAAGPHGMLSLRAVTSAGGAHDVNGAQGSHSWGPQRPAPDGPSTAITPGAPATSPGSAQGSPSAAGTLHPAAPSTASAAHATKAATSAADASPPALPGWSLDWSDSFNTPLDQTGWARYGYGGQAPGQGGMGLYRQSNAFTANGNLVLRTQYQNGAWSSAGVSSGDFYSASGGRWEIRAKFPVAKGIGYDFLLWPADGTWPPEVDIAEGRVNGPQVMATYHWGSANNRDSQYLSNSTMSAWHTYGVVIGSGTITYTFDGKPWATITTNVTTTKMWLGFQCAAMDPSGSANQYETVDNGVPGPLTPAVNDIQIAWVAHYRAA